VVEDGINPPLRLQIKGQLSFRCVPQPYSSRTRSCATLARRREDEPSQAEADAEQMLVVREKVELVCSPSWIMSTRERPRRNGSFPPNKKAPTTRGRRHKGHVRPISRSGGGGVVISAQRLQSFQCRKNTQSQPAGAGASDPACSFCRGWWPSPWAKSPRASLFLERAPIVSRPWCGAAASLTSAKILSELMKSATRRKGLRVVETS